MWKLELESSNLEASTAGAAKEVETREPQLSLREGYLMIELPGKVIV